jgi:hypothetical protein
MVALDVPRHVLRRFDAGTRVGSALPARVDEQAVVAPRTTEPPRRRRRVAHVFCLSPGGAICSPHARQRPLASSGWLPYRRHAGITVIGSASRVVSVAAKAARAACSSSSMRCRRTSSAPFSSSRASQRAARASRAASTSRYVTPGLLWMPTIFHARSASRIVSAWALTSPAFHRSGGVGQEPREERARAHGADRRGPQAVATQPQRRPRGQARSVRPSRMSSPCHKLLVKSS